MTTRCLVGTVDPDAPSTARVRYIHADGHPAYMLPALYLIWSRTCGRDTTALVEALLAHQWSYLGADVTDHTAATFPGEHPIPGVGMVSEFDADSQIGRLPLNGAADGDARWVYLIDPTATTIAVHDADDLTTPVDTHRIATP